MVFLSRTAPLQLRSISRQTLLQDRTLTGKFSTTWLNTNSRSYCVNRFVFLLFNQPSGFKDQKEVGPDTSLTGFNISQFADNCGLGEPVAGTYMLVGPQN